jgi:hypothetical protein
MLEFIRAVTMTSAVGILVYSALIFSTIKEILQELRKRK